MGWGRKRFRIPKVYIPQISQRQAGGQLLCRDKASVVSLVNSENSPPGVSNWDPQGAEGRTLPAQAEPLLGVRLLGARRAAQGYSASRERPSSGPLHLYQPGLATSESLPTILRAGTPVAISTQPTGTVFSRASVLGHRRKASQQLREMGTVTPSFTDSKPRLRKVRILSTHDREGHRTKSVFCLL